MKHAVLVLFVVASATSAFAGSAYNELNPSQQQAIQSGEQVLVQINVPGAPWPKLKIYQRIAATPEETAAVGMDYVLKTAYTADLKSARIAQIVNPQTIDVDYVVDLPLISDEAFTLRHWLGTQDGGKSYLTTWTLVKARRTKASEGTTRYEPLGTGTLMAVETFTDPGSSLAGMMRDKATKKSADAARSFVKQVEKEHSEQSKLLQDQLQKMRASLKSK